MSQLVVIILAAGQGKRMKSDLPKVLHHLGGRTLLEFVVDAAYSLDPAEVRVVYGHGGEQVPQTLHNLEVTWIPQTEQLGTGHAVLQAMPGIPDQATVLVLYGDVPLVNRATLEQVVAQAGRSQLALVTVQLDEPTGYGRIVRNPLGRIAGIIEERDADEHERAIPEVNTGILATNAGRLCNWLTSIKHGNAQGEYYLTDVIALAARDSIAICGIAPNAIEEVLGVNDRLQLAHLERYFQRLQAEQLMCTGVTLRDPARLDVRGTIDAGRDVILDVNVLLEGRVVLGDGVSIGPNVVIRDSEIGAHTQVLANCVIERACTGANCQIGPFSRLRPGAQLSDGVHVGNFVEIKQSRIGAGSKVNHLTYVGDTEVGKRVNIGAGTITCNYDGAFKHRTIIGDDAFIGSGTELVAPVSVGPGSTTGAGSTITRDIAPGQLAVSRNRQVAIRGWKRPTKPPSKTS